MTNMKKRIGPFCIYQMVSVLAVALVLIIIGTFLDFNISSSIVKAGNVFGKAMGLFGSLPYTVIGGLTGVLFFVAFREDKGGKRNYWAYAALILIPLATGAFYGYQSLADYISKKVIAIVLGAIITGASEFGLYQLIKNADRHKAFYSAVTILICLAIIFLFGYGLKLLAARPRYLYVLEKGGSADFYRTWYAFDSSLRDAAKAASDTYNADMFASFPSGHVLFATLGLYSVILSDLNEKLKTKQPYFFYGSFVLVLLVAAGRISDGHHYLSDVGFSILIGAGTCFLVSACIYIPGINYSLGKGGTRRRYGWKDHAVLKNQKRNESPYAMRDLLRYRKANNRFKYLQSYHRPFVKLGRDKEKKQ